MKREACATPPSRGVVVVHTAQNESCESRLRCNVGGRWAKKCVARRGTAGGHSGVVVVPALTRASVGGEGAGVIVGRRD